VLFAHVGEYVVAYHKKVLILGTVSTSYPPEDRSDHDADAKLWRKHQCRLSTEYIVVYIANGQGD
jgi:hypothetical protein